MLARMRSLAVQGRIDAQGIKRHPWFTSQPESPAAQIHMPPERQTVSEIQLIIERARERRDRMLERQRQANGSAR